MCLSGFICMHGSYGSPETGVNNGCEPLCGCCKLNPGQNLQEQQVLLSTKPSLHYIMVKFQGISLLTLLICIPTTMM